jgi:hypothetical protein
MHKNLIVYKNNIVNIPYLPEESHKDFEMRKWYILKNIHVTNENGCDNAICSLDELINYSKLYIRKENNKCVFDTHNMEMNKTFEKNLFIRSNFHK